MAWIKKGTPVSQWDWFCDACGHSETRERLYRTCNKCGARQGGIRQKVASEKDAQPK